MDKLIVKGSTAIKGKVNISGSKNAALPIMAASLLCAKKCFLYNIPALTDIKTMAFLLSRLGARVEENETAMVIDSANVNSHAANYDIVRKMRASAVVLGPLLCRFKKAVVSLPGGCAIGARPMDIHLNALKKMGAEIDIEAGYIKAKVNKSLLGANIVFDKPSVGATQNIMMAATLAKGLTTIQNAAQEPEIKELALVLRSMGARIDGESTSTINIEGVEELQAFKHKISGDRIEAATFACIAAATKGDIEIAGVSPDNLKSFLEKLHQSGCLITPFDNGFRVQSSDRLKPVDISTAPHPGFPTDIQAQWMACMALASGTSVIEENVFENRFMHVPELVRMGADITISGNKTIVKGVKQLKAAPVMATDLRASASLLIAALCAEQMSEIRRIYHLDRGYAQIDKKLSLMGAHIFRIQQEIDLSNDEFMQI